MASREAKRTTTKEGLLISKEPRVNERIRAREVRLVDPDGGQIGIKGIDEARWLADQLGLDLVEVAADSRPPVVRMMDYGKYKYEQSVRAREARKNQARTVIKEVQFRPKIGQSDFEVKRKRVVRFLGEGDKVKVTMRFRGREVTHPELGRDILKRLTASVENLGVVETPPRLEGRQMTLVLAPVRRSVREKYEADQAAEAEAQAEYEALEDDGIVAEEVAAAVEVTEAAAVAETDEAVEAVEVVALDEPGAEAAVAVEAVEVVALDEAEAAVAVEAVEVVALDEAEAAVAVESEETQDAGEPGQEPAPQ